MTDSDPFIYLELNTETGATRAYGYRNTDEFVSHVRIYRDQQCDTALLYDAESARKYLDEKFPQKSKLIDKEFFQARKWNDAVLIEARKIGWIT